MTALMAVYSIVLKTYLTDSRLQPITEQGRLVVP